VQVIFQRSRIVGESGKLETMRVPLITSQLPTIPSEC
jgi:hypothetical protein